MEVGLYFWTEEIYEKIIFYFRDYHSFALFYVFKLFRR